MIAAVIRHAKVDIEWEFWQTSKEYDQGCADYDTAPVLPVEVHLPDADFKTIYVSDLSRTAATARQVVGDRELTATALINEVPEKSGFDTELKLPGMLWSGISRIQWFLCSRRQPESRKETERRAFTQDSVMVDGLDGTIKHSHQFAGLRHIYTRFLYDHPAQSYEKARVSTGSHAA